MKICISHVFLLILLSLLSCNSAGKNDQAFEKMLWHRNPDFRHLMIESLEKSKILDKKNIGYVIDLLGKPMKKNKSFHAYNLGRPKGRMKPADPIYFIIEFDNQGNVSIYYINTEPLKKK